MEEQQKFEFMKEKVKERPLNKRKLMRRTLITVSMAVLFGLTACLTFSALEPVISNWLNPQEKIEEIEIPLVTEEILPEDMIEHEETTIEPSQEIIDTLINEIQLGTQEYQQLYQSIYSLVQEIRKAEVTITGITQEINMFNDAYESTGQCIGYIFEQNSTEILIFTEEEKVRHIENPEVVFADGSRTSAVIRGTDANTGLAVLAAAKAKIGAETLNDISYISLGDSSASSILASPVIALGNPLGNSSVVYGMITSADTTVSMTDRNYRLLTTDIYGSQDAAGILTDLGGNVIGILCQEHNKEETKNLLSALGISEIKYVLQRMANGQPNSYLGIQGTDVPAEIVRTREIPMGVYVTGIVLDSPAMQAGIQSGDILVRVDKTKIISFSDYTKALADCKPGDTKVIHIMRKGQDGYKEAEIEVVVGNLE